MVEEIESKDWPNPPQTIEMSVKALDGVFVRI